MKGDLALLARLNRPVPRYTSYPTALQFYPMQEREYRERLVRFDASEKSLSLYIHIPFCRSMCLFCACSVVLNRRPERQQVYLEALFREIEALPFTKRRNISQLHVGGGTPTSLTEVEFSQLMQKLQERFFWGKEAEISIEIDPRTVFADKGAKLAHLKRLGFNRVSFGVQDLDPRVQEAVKRRQSEEMTEATYRRARDLGFAGINLDLIYGLPHQSPESFRTTVEKIAALRPDRISLFSYAKVPWLKPHQRAIPEESLPSAEEKLQIYIAARQQFEEAGYVAIGMDHFSLSDDPLAEAYREKRLKRNFQGYSVDLAEDMIGLGMSAIGYIEGYYFQNEKELSRYQEKALRKELPVERGFALKEEDLVRRFAIHSLMCHFELDKSAFGAPFDIYFSKEREKIEALKKEGLLEETKTHLFPTPLGCLFIRLIAAAFDAYFEGERHSRAI